MGRLWTITFLLAIGAVPARALAAPPETAAAAAPPAARAPATARQDARQAELLPPILYLKAGARLFNKGQVDDALKYFKAANSLRGHLTENERVVLEVYLEEVDKYKKLAAARAAAAVADAAAKDPDKDKNKAAEKPAASSVAGTGKTPSPAPARSTDNAVAPASLTTPIPASAPALKTQAATPAGALMPSAPQTERIKPRDAAILSEAGPSELTRARFATSDLKQKARWLLHEARYELHHSRFDEALKKVEQARALKVEWTRFDETPDKMTKAIEAAQAKAKNAKPPTVRPLGIRLLNSPDPGTAR